MKYLNTVIEGGSVSRVALGCMRLNQLTDTEVESYLLSSIEYGYNYFDHADIYGGGRCEELFGKALASHKELRDRIFIQTKCSICKGMYDFSKAHIISSVEKSLKRLRVDSIDVLLLHRPDLLMDPDDVASAFDTLYESGKVKAFGVSNHSPLQIELLKKSVKQRLVINQLQLSLTNAQMISSGANVNLDNSDGLNRDGYVRDYCRLNGITIQPWSPLQKGFIGGTFLGNPDYRELNNVIGEMAEKYNVSNTGIAIAWLLRLPEKMQPVVGSTSAVRLKQIADAADITLSSEDWYKLYLAAGYRLP